MDFNQRKDVIRYLFIFNFNDIQNNGSARIDRIGDLSFKEKKLALDEPQILTWVTVLSWKQYKFIYNLFRK